MAEESFEERTEAPSEKRRQEAREKGTVAKSTEVNSVLVLLAGLTVLHILGPWMFDKFNEMFITTYSYVANPPADDEERAAAVELGMQLFGMNPGMATNMLNATACDADHLTDLFFEVWHASNEAQVYWFWPNAWNRTCGNVWADTRFVDYVEEIGLDEYWRVAGWPTMCRQDGVWR